MQNDAKTAGELLLPKRSCRPAYWRWFAVGFSVGVLAPTIYLLFGGSDFWDVPRWATVLFYPGFWTGYYVHENIVHSKEVARVAGCITVGVSYGGIALLSAWTTRKLSRFQRNQALGKEKHEKESTSPTHRPHE